MRRFIPLPLTAVALALLAFAARPGPAWAQQPIVIKLGNVQATADIVQTGLKKFADLVNERTKGRIQVQIFKLHMANGSFRGIGHTQCGIRGSATG